MLRIQIKDRRDPPLPLADKLFNIGSASDNHLVLSDPSVDPLHARLVNSGGQVMLRDNDSRSGCFVNGQRVTRREIHPGDEIRLGSVVIEILDDSDDSTHRWKLVADSWLAGRTFPLPADRPAVIGRDASCDIVIAGTHLSRRHAQLHVQGEQVQIRDLGSVNGTFLNDSPIEEALARSGDQLRIDVYSFRIAAPEEETVLIPQSSDSDLHETMDGKPRRWKTRPTSPGNREEPTYREQGLSGLWFWLILAGATLAFIASVYFFSW